MSDGDYQIVPWAQLPPVLEDMEQVWSVCDRLATKFDFKYSGLLRQRSMTSEDLRSELVLRVLMGSNKTNGKTMKLPIPKNLLWTVLWRDALDLVKIKNGNFVPFTLEQEEEFS